MPIAPLVVISANFSCRSSSGMRRVAVADDNATSSLSFVAAMDLDNNVAPHLLIDGTLPNKDRT